MGHSKNENVFIDNLDIKKILIKFPKGFNNAIGGLPFLVAVSEEFPKAELNIILEESDHLEFKFLPFKVNVFVRPAHQQSLHETHKFCVNLHEVFNIDLFFDLENTFNSAFMGFNFRAKERIGYIQSWNKLFLTKKFEKPQGNIPFEILSIKLLEKYLNKSFDTLRISKELKDIGSSSKEIEQLFIAPESSPVVLVMLDNFLNFSKQVEIWKQFFDSFKGQKFVIWSREDEGGISDLMSTIDLGHNNLYLKRGHDLEGMSYLLRKVKGVITQNFWNEGLCNYLGVNCIHFLHEPDLAQIAPSFYYFKHKSVRVTYRSSEDKNLAFIIDDQTPRTMNEVVDFIHLNWNL